MFSFRRRAINKFYVDDAAGKAGNTPNYKNQDGLLFKLKQQYFKAVCVCIYKIEMGLLQYQLYLNLYKFL